MKRKAAASQPLRVTLLGTGDAFASGGRSQSGYLIESRGTRILLEAGPDILGMLKRARIAPDSIDVVLISHLHGDHFAGLAFLYLEYLFESPRRKPLTLIGPPHLEAGSLALMKAIYPNFDLTSMRRKLKFRALTPGKVDRVGAMKVLSIRSPHTKPDISLSLRLEIDGRAVAFSGDSGWNEQLVDFVRGADLFLCECTYYESSQFKFHMNYPQLAANRARFDVGRMVLTHLGREVLARGDRLGLEAGRDGMTIDL